MIAIVDGCGSNIASLQYAIERLGYSAILTADPKIIANASHVILAGVSAAQSAMQQLQNHQLLETIQQLTQPVLGICLGMQLLFEFSEESNVKMLGIITGAVKKLSTDNNTIVPHMGWNQIKITVPSSPLFIDIPNKSYMYFAHSYAVSSPEYAIVATEHGQSFTSAVQKNNFYGVQFHPELSGKIGERLLFNFFNI